MKKYNKKFKESGYLRKDGFSKEFLKNPVVKDYLKDNDPFGYFGHAFRSCDLDSFFEDLFVDKGYLTNEELGEWLTSGPARHWMDSLVSFLYLHLKSQRKQFVQMVKSDLQKWATSKYPHKI